MKARIASPEPCHRAVSAMPSWQARCLTLAIRVVMRRATWGDPQAPVRRARRLFGAPNPLGWLRTRALRVERVGEGLVRGEWLSAERADRGVILCLHGGGYVACSSSTHRPITAALARMAGRRVFALDDRLAPEHRFPAALDDAVAAYRWLLGRSHAPQSLALADKVRAAGGASTLQVFDGVFHVWQMLDGVVPEARLALRQAAAFMNDPSGAARRS